MSPSQQQRKRKQQQSQKSTTTDDDEEMTIVLRSRVVLRSLPKRVISDAEAQEISLPKRKKPVISDAEVTEDPSDDDDDDEDSSDDDDDDDDDDGVSELINSACTTMRTSSIRLLDIHSNKIKGNLHSEAVVINQEISKLFENPDLKGIIYYLESFQSLVSGIRKQGINPIKIYQLRQFQNIHQSPDRSGILTMHPYF